MDLQIEVDMDLQNHQGKCRCCLKDLYDENNCKSIDNSIRNYFYELTQITLIESQELSNEICQTCFVDLQTFHELRIKFTEKQSKLYDFIKKPVIDPADVPGFIKVEIDVEEEEYIEYELLDHKTEYISEEETYFCDICKFKSTAKRILERHMKGSHMLTTARKKYVKEPQEFFCEACGLKFDKKFHLNAHKRSKHTEKLRNHICHVCEKAFYSSENLKKHVESHNEKQLPCEYCGRLFSCINNLRTHLYYHGQARFECTYEGCDKKFFMKKSLRSHLKTHVNQKDFMCEYCDKSYFTQNDLNRHIFSIHKKLRFFCEEPGCQGNFSRREYYKKHAVTHHQNLGPEKFEILLQKIKVAVPVQKMM